LTKISNLKKLTKGDDHYFRSCVKTNREERESNFLVGIELFTVVFKEPFVVFVEKSVEINIDIRKLVIHLGVGSMA
jgi:hypothetical protein